MWDFAPVMRHRPLLTLLLAGAIFMAEPVHGADAPRDTATGAPYVPSPQSIVARMLELAGVDGSDFVIDLGSGDGRIVLTAAKVFGARGLGVEIREDLVRQSRQAAARLGVDDQVRFVHQDLFDTDLSGADVVTIYLLPETVNRLKGKLLRELRSGTRVVSHDYPIEGWQPRQVVRLEHPAKVDVTGVERTLLYLYELPEAAIGGQPPAREAPPEPGSGDAS